MKRQTTRAISEPNGNVFKICNEQDYSDPSLQSWTEVKDAHKREIQVKKSYSHSYVYCLYESIILNARKYRCPPFVLKLDIHQPFQTGKFVHTAGLKSSNIEDHILESTFQHINYTLSVDHTFQDQMALIDTIKKNNEKQKDINELELSTIRIKTNDPVIWIVVLGSVLIVTLCLTTCISMLKPKLSQSPIVAVFGNQQPPPIPQPLVVSNQDQYSYPNISQSQVYGGNVIYTKPNSG